MRRPLRIASALVIALLFAAFVARPLEAAKRRRRNLRPAPAAPALSGELADRLATLAKKSGFGGSQLGIAVAEVGKGAKPVLLFNGDKPLILASTTKVFTTSSAFDKLGTDYKFRTRLYRDAEITADGTLNGRLIVVGGGDPAISGRLYDNDPLAAFRMWADALARMGVRKIRDGLQLDTSFFDDLQIHPDWPAEQEQNWWQAPISALSYNDNVVLVRATGSGRPGVPAQLGFLPFGPPLLTVRGRVTTVPGYGSNVRVRREAGSREVLASGLVGRNATWTGDVTVPDPPLYFAGALRAALREAGIELGGDSLVKPHANKGALTLLHTHETPILPAISICNKRSQSFYAEQILKTLGAEGQGRGTWENGEKEVRSFLQRLGLDPSHYELVDGSGRSRANRASPVAYLDFLEALATRWDKFPLYESSLAVSGDMDGSLRHRMLGPFTKGRVHAKTGNLNGVVTLAGYVKAQSNKVYAFCILINGGGAEGGGHAFQDRFVTEIARSG